MRQVSYYIIKHAHDISRMMHNFLTHDTADIT